MKLLLSQYVPKYSMGAVPKEIKDVLKKSKIKLSKKSYFIDLREEPDDPLEFAVIDEKNGQMILYIDNTVYLLERDEELENCDGYEAVLVSSPEGDDYIYDLLVFKMPPMVFRSKEKISDMEIAIAYYYAFPPNAYLYPLLFVKRMSDEQKEMWRKRLERDLEMEIPEDFICDAYIALSDEEIKKYLEILSKEKEE